MPKGKKKGKYDHKRTEVYSSDEDAGIDMGDNYSETSGQSDMKSTHDDADNELQEKLEDKVVEAIDALSARSNAARAAALVSLRAVLQRRHLSHVLANHRATLADHVTRMLRRGKDGERRAAAAIAPTLALQIGDDFAEEFIREVRPALTAVATDKTASLDCRTECCSSLAILCYLLEDDLAEILEVLRVYETIFSGSYLKGDGTVKVTGSAVEEGAYHAAALDGWALLLPLLPAHHAAALLNEQPPGFARLGGLLEACSVEVRMAAGGALAIAYELIEECFDDPQQHIEDMLPRLRELVKDSCKFRAKRDRKIQRATFRDILKYFEDDEIPSLTIRVGTEQITLESWAGQALYSHLARTLGAALVTMAPHSGVLRSALGLSETPAIISAADKVNKRTRHLQNNAACKARTLARNKNRDKRSATLAL
ncbi:interferon-related developmental regulator 1 isoform X1 [Plutella xylostella]|uniref:interferon-related developmental regulator 1 isoform X1 n=1 Tax=Plutella xylostella TaxID=51655 RepID=UPI0005D0E45C|nr:interferon-related developmental regulator 1 isoform X1 [Plutella xylostella]